MTDLEIEVLLADLRDEFGDQIDLQYQAPVVPGSCHALELESSCRLGTISIWPTGAIDWHIFEVSTSQEAFLGNTEVGSKAELRALVLDLFQRFREF